MNAPVMLDGKELILDGTKVAWHADRIAKWERGFSKVINIQGTDHHGTIARVRGGPSISEIVKDGHRFTSALVARLRSEGFAGEVARNDVDVNPIGCQMLKCRNLASQLRRPVLSDSHRR
mgnify:CR=1 FL=1